MASTYNDRLNGITTSVAVKAPCVVRTTANITLSGTQTIDGVAVVADDRVLVVAQTTTSENGIWVASATAWARADDFDGAGDVVCGTLITVTGGSTISGSPIWRVTTANPIVIGTTGLTISASGFTFSGSVGTMAAQNATAVNIDGGTVDGTILGGASPAAATFTTATASSFTPNGGSSSDGMYLAAAGNVAFTANGRPIFRLNGAGASAVNYVSINNTNTGSIPTVRAVGDTNCNIGWSSKGSGGHYFYTNDTGQTQFRITHIASAVNHMVIQGGAAGGAPELYASGSDTDITFKLTPKGAGVLQFGTTGCFTNNATSSISVTSLGPLGLATPTIKKWLTVKDSAGATLYIPAWGN